MVIKSIIVSLVGAVLCLDRIVPQIMLSRPIIAGPITGLVLGDPYTGLVIGAFIELLWIDRSPIGVYVPPNDTIVAVCATAGSILVGNTAGQVNPELIALSVLLFVPLGIVGQRVDIYLFRSNDRLSEATVCDAREGNTAGISKNHLLGILKSFVSMAVLQWVALIVGTAALQALFTRMPGKLLEVLTYVYFFIPVLGVAVALTTVKLRGAIPLFSGIFLLGTLIMQVW
jgi:PTS system mannose-specific IIC component